MSSKTSGFFFCGIIELPIEISPESVAKPNSDVVKSMRSVESRLACTKKRAVA
jgi:hypothetical protein